MNVNFEYFIRFLKDKNAYKIFFENFYSENGVNFRNKFESIRKKDVIDFFKDENASQLINTFIWELTKQKLKFWEKIDSEWRKICNYGS